MAENPVTYLHQSGLHVRDKGDEGIVKEQNEWKPLIKHAPFHTALDIGGHIGTFVWWAKKNLGVERVVSIEPTPESCEVYRQNHPDGELIEAACMRTGGDDVPLYLGRTYSACNSLEAWRGRQAIRVKRVIFNDVINSVKPDLIKCDIEGGEYTLPWNSLPACVRAVAMELHYHRRHWKAEAERIDWELLELGFKHEKAPRYNSFTKQCIAIWVRL